MIPCGRCCTHSWFVLSDVRLLQLGREWVVWAGGPVSPQHTRARSREPWHTFSRVHSVVSVPTDKPDMLCATCKIHTLTETLIGAEDFHNLGLGSLSFWWLLDEVMRLPHVRNSLFYNVFLHKLSLSILKHPSPSFRFSHHPLSLFLSSICLSRSPCGLVSVVADEMRLHLKWAMLGGVCSDTDHHSSVKPLKKKKHPSTSGPAKLLLSKTWICVFFFSFSWSFVSFCGT